MHRTPVTRHQQPSSRWVVALAAALLTATPSWSAHAQEDDPSSSAPIKAAKMLYDAGRTSADNGEWEKAYEWSKHYGKIGQISVSFFIFDLTVLQATS